MKILYSVQATGNGHISRAMELLPFIKQYGEVDIFLSGANSSLDFNLPVKYRSKGLSLFYTCKGKLNYSKTAFSISPWRVMKDVRDLPVEKYDLILNDFECITAIACAIKKMPSVNFGHQASFQSSKTPRPKEKNKFGEWILKNYARASFHIGLHFQPYDNFIFSPVIKKEICEAEPGDKGFFAVYLPSYCEDILEKYFHRLNYHRFYIFSSQANRIKRNGNITFLPVARNLFNEALINCSGIITGAGFETPAEALKLEKKLMVIPIKDQYEQQCNAAALEEMGVKRIDKLDDDFKDHFTRWTESKAIKIKYDHSTEDIITRVMDLSAEYLNKNQRREEEFDLTLLPSP
jgi:uncharacterized protein (TIGR00661 family)